MATRRKVTNRRMIDLDTFLDECGVRVNQCCASCKYKRFNTETSRLCTLGYGIVSPKDPPCKDYDYVQFFHSPKVIGQGKIKRRSYLRFYEENYVEVKERLKMENEKAGKPFPTPSPADVVAVIRTKYEQKFGVPYTYNF